MWSYRHIVELRKKVLSFTEEEKVHLTWDEAKNYIPADTLRLAFWSGMNKRRDCTPYEAICRVSGIET